MALTPQDRPPDRAGTSHSATVSRKLEIGAEQKKGRKRSRGTGLTRRIQRTAQARQAAWLATGQRNLTERLTSELDVLYDDVRDERRGVNPGRHLHTSLESVR